MKPAHCLALALPSLCLSLAAQAAIPAPLPAERLVVADAGKRAAQPAAPGAAVAAGKEAATPKARESAPRKADKTEVDFTLHWYP